METAHYLLSLSHLLKGHFNTKKKLYNFRKNCYLYWALLISCFGTIGMNATINKHLKSWWLKKTVTIQKKKYVREQNTVLFYSSDS